jgi:hypothetical protein
MDQQVRNDEKAAVEVELVESPAELLEAELDAIAGALMDDHCPTYKPTVKTWGF